MAERIILYSGPKHVGKTTALQAWAAARTDVAGFFTPVVHSRRYFLDVETGAQFPMEAMDGEPTLEIGRYRFSAAAFTRAGVILMEAMGRQPILVVDEIGPLELQGKGFAHVVRALIQHLSGTLVLVVREELLQDVKDYFQIPQAKIVFSPKAPI